MNFSPALPPARLLVVDDEPEIAQSLVDFLVKKEGYLISVASDGQEAIGYLQTALANKQDIDLVLLDMRMPNVSGLDVLEWIRKHPVLQLTRVVLLTATVGSNEKVEALSAGADDYITKPYYPEELLARVKTILRTQQLEKQLQRQSQQLAALNRLAQTVAATLETQELLAAAAEGIDTVWGVALSAVFMVESGHLRCNHLRGKRGPLPADSYPPLPVTHGILGVTFAEKTAVSLNTPSEDPRFNPATDAPPRTPIQNLMAAPLVLRGHPVGVLAVYNKEDGPFSEVDLDLFVSLANSVSEAIQNAWLFQRNRLRQQELLEGRNTLQALIDGIPNPIYTINDHWHLVAINKSKKDELSGNSGGLTGQVCYQTFFGRDAPCEHCLAPMTLNEKEARHWSVRWFGLDRLPREWDVNAYPIPGTQAGSARAVVVWQDRTEERRLESSLLQAGKLAAIGQLAAGVAHEINNPLTAINANAQLLKMVIPVEDENYEAVDLISRAGERAAKVVQELLDFARQEHYAFRLGSVNDSIQQALRLVFYQLQTAQIQMIQVLAEDLPLITASWEHLKSVWLNLLVNARDALLHRANGRFIEITTRFDPEEETIQVLVRDNGKGISPAELAHIFEPFYTTKEPGKGTGLGLANCHRIIEQHEGEIQAVSVPLEGTTFIVRLPLRVGSVKREV